MFTSNSPENQRRETPNTFTRTEMAPYITGVHRSSIEQAEKLKNQPYQTYEHPQAAQNIPVLNNSRQMLEKAGRAYEPYGNEAYGYIRNQRDEDRWENPESQQYRTGTDPYTNLIRRRLNGINGLDMSNKVNGLFRGAQYSNPAQQMREAKERELDYAGYKSLKDKDRYRNQDIYRMLEAAKLASGAGIARQGSQLGLAGANQSLAEYMQNQAQLEKDVLRQDFERQQEYPYEQMRKLAAIMRASPMEKHTTGVYAPHTPETRVNTVGQVGSLAGNILGATQAISTPTNSFNPADYTGYISAEKAKTLTEQNKRDIRFSGR